jgi:hypothetical protein
METSSTPVHHDLRRQDREPCDHKVMVLWRDPSGEDKFVHAKTLDICEWGLRLQMPEALPRLTYLMLGAPKLGLVGHASVRHCARISGSKFSVGVEFAAGMRWLPEA